MGDLPHELNTVYSYHDETKHHFQRHARSLGYLDWASQPDPFRRYLGAEVVRLSLPETDERPTWDGLFTGAVEPAPPDLESINRFFYFSLALSAWKQVVSPEGEVASRWALRVNPSSGNLHPTEGYLVDPEGVFHYAPDEHVLEKRAGFEPEQRDIFTKNLTSGSFLAGLTSIHWREAWKYGERAFRYCQHDVGHALAAMALSAARLGWRIRLLNRPGSDQIERLLGVADQTEPEKEYADCLMAVFPGTPVQNLTFSTWPRAVSWAGTPNRLSRKHQDWLIIPEIAAATRWPGAALDADPDFEPAGKSNITPGGVSGEKRGLSAGELIRNRRSAVAMDGETTLERDELFRLLTRLMPGPNHPVFSAAPELNHVSLALFVHRVEGVAPGLYLLVRNPDHEESLRSSLRQDFSWTRPEGCPEELPLFMLGRGDLRQAARKLSCGQDIAADGAFSVGMLARFDHALQKSGPGMYPRLFWETGMVGQMLYLEAEAARIRGTGIGCFYDDEVHRALGIDDHAWQSLYHFTVGGAVDDDRLQTAPAY